MWSWLHLFIEFMIINFFTCLDSWLVTNLSIDTKYYQNSDTKSQQALAVENIMARRYSKLIQDEFFTQAELTSRNWLSRFGTKSKDSLHGYENLVNHVQTDHPNELNEPMKYSASGSSISASPSKSLWYSKKRFRLMTGWNSLFKA